jgi:hypothetical protein
MQMRLGIAMSPVEVEKVEGPRWKDGCKHRAEEYVGTVMVGDYAYDVYVYAGGDWGGACCIRYGDMAWEYISPGSVLDLLLTAFQHHEPPYTYALRLILQEGTLEYRRKEVDDEG